MVVEKLPEVVPPAGRVPEEVFRCSRSWKRGGGRTEERLRKRVPVMGVSRHEEYMTKGGSQGATRGPPGGPGGPLARPPPRAPGGALGPWWVPPAPPPPSVIPEASVSLIFLLDFSRIF